MLPILLSLLGLGGGVGALAYFMGPAALLGFAKSALKLLARIPWQIWLGAALAALLAFLIISRGHALERAKAAEARNDQICATVRKVAGRPRQDCRLAELQIQAFGRSIGELEGALADQNSAIRALAKKQAVERAAGAAAERQARSRGAEAESIAAKLIASSKKAPAQPCAVSKALEEQWK